MALKYRHEAEVTFRGHFPLDMLRYDCCYPADLSVGRYLSIKRQLKTRGIL